jgi:hypothetical protein
MFAEKRSVVNAKLRGSDMSRGVSLPAHQSPITIHSGRGHSIPPHSTVTLFAKFRGLSTSHPRATAT